MVVARLTRHFQFIDFWRRTAWACLATAGVLVASVVAPIVSANGSQAEHQWRFRDPLPNDVIEHDLLEFPRFDDDTVDSRVRDSQGALVSVDKRRTEMWSYASDLMTDKEFDAFEESLNVLAKPRGNQFNPIYPYEYEQSELLDLSVDWDRIGASAMNDLAGLVLIAELDPATTNDWVAFHLLHKSRGLRLRCSSQFNLGILLAGLRNNPQTIVARELSEASEICDDPTPLWILALHQASHVRVVESPSPYDRWGDVAVGVDAVRETVDRLQSKFPTSALGWSAEADVELAFGLERESQEPFTARDHFRRAAERFIDLSARFDDPRYALGLQRAKLHLDAPNSKKVEIDHSMSGADLQVLHLQAAETALRLGDLRKASLLIEDAPAASGQRGFFPTGQYSMDVSRTPLVVLRRRPFWGNLGLGDGAGPGFTQSRPYLPESRHDLVSEIYSFDVTGILPLRAGEPREVLAGLEMDAIPDGEFASSWSDRHDAIQDGWRWLGELDKAELFLRESIRRDPTSIEPVGRLGEVLYLMARFDEAHATFAQELEMLAKDGRTNVSPYWLAEMKMAVAGKEVPALRENAVSLLEDLAARPGTVDPDSRLNLEYVAWHANLELTANALEYEGDLDLARSYLEVADATRATARSLDFGGPDIATSVSLNASYGAYIQSEAGELEAAERSALQSLDTDPLNPLSLQTAGYVAQQRSDLGTSIERYEAALAQDATLFSAANDLGVAKAALGDRVGAAEAFRHAIFVNDEFALAWHNLGVLYANDVGLRSFVQSQGALARAGRLDRSLRGTELDFIVDATAYFVALDVSRPLPERWVFSEEAQTRLLPVGGSVVIVTLGLLAFNLAADRVAGATVDGFLRRRRKLPALVRRRVGAPVSLIAVVAASVWAGASQVSAIHVAFLMLTAVMLLGLYLAVRSDLKDRCSMKTTDDFSPLPALGLTLLTTGAGFPWLCLPVGSKSEFAQLRARLALGCLIGVSLVALFFSAMTALPVARSVGILALTFSATVLTPVRPYEGLDLGSPRLVLVVETLFLVMAGLVFLRIL